MMPVKMSYRFLALVALALIVAGVFYRAVLPGLSSARNEPPGVEVALATYLLHYSVPDAQKQRANPLGSDPAEITAGRDLFRQKCEICHAYDGSGKTDIGAKLYPRPPALRSIDVTSMPDGEIFYHIRNGIRNTGMPAWDMPDRRYLATGCLYPPLAERSPREAQRRLRRNQRRSASTLHRFGGLPEMPRGRLCAVEQNRGWRTSYVIHASILTPSFRTSPSPTRL